MKSLTLFAAFAAAPFLGIAVTHAAAEAAPAAKAPVAGFDSVGVVSPKVVPSVVTKAKNFGCKPQLDAFTEALENRLTDALAGTRKFKVVTRADLDSVLKEQNLAASGNLDANDPQTARAFKLAGAKYILLVTVDDFQDRIETLDSPATGQRYVRRTIRAGAGARLIDATTGAVKESVSIPVVTEADLRGVLAAATVSADRADAIAPELARLVSERVAQRLVDARFPAKVLAKSADGVVTFNRGDGSGVQIGQQWGVYAVGEALVDPDTGETLGAEEVQIARAVVTDVEARFSKAKLVKDLGVTAGAVMRPLTVQPVASVEAAPQTPVAPPAARSATLVMDKDRKLTLDGREITPETASAEFAKLAGTKVVLRLDPTIPAASVQKVLKSLGDAGVTDIVFDK